MLNLVNNITYCIELAQTQLPNVLIYYSHIPVMVLCLLFVLLIVRRNSEDSLNKYFIAMSLLFFAWTTLDLVVWTMAHKSALVMAAWSTLELIEVMFFYVCILLANTFFTGHDMKISFKIGLLLPTLIVWFYTLGGQILHYYHTYNCEAVENSFIVNKIVLGIDLFYVGIICLLYLYTLRLNRRDIKRNTVFFLGLLTTLIIYLVSLYISEYVENYNWSLIALTSMPFFLTIIGFMAVRFKIFSFKVLGANLLVFSSVFIVGTQFIFIESLINFILNSVTFVLLMIAGIFLVKSVKKIDTQREQLAIANAEQEVLMHFITHQIKGFFTKSRNILDTISDEAEALSPSINRLVQEGLRSDKEGIDLVQNILNAANLKNGKITYVDNFFDMNALVKNVIKELESSAKTKDLIINYYCTTAPIQVKADEARMKDVVRNLIQNAILYTFKGGANISLAQHDTHIEFTVKDTGIGLTESDKSRLFQSGGRGEESVKYNTGSTGYGLFIAKKVVDNYKGFIWAESEGRDKGSKFTVVLPIAQPLVK